MGGEGVPVCGPQRDGMGVRGGCACVHIAHGVCAFLRGRGFQNEEGGSLTGGNSQDGGWSWREWRPLSDKALRPPSCVD